MILHKFLKTAHRIVAGVYIHIITVAADFVFEIRTIKEVLQSQLIHTPNSPGFANTEHGSGRYEFHILITA
ncbi:hypothetical protein SDC9_211956 [bioreactor metagenome]|uniref:Uncharacterized protein n=1 Tax=bioreactor metagenome TaxID=1076179 RepID=A0A645JKJ2_9ZZZZ